jgi:Acetyltransferase (GNAT) domain
MKNSGNNIDVRVARTLAEVEALRQQWVAWPSHRDSDIDFYLMIVQSYPEVLRPHVMALYRGGELAAIMVGRLERKRIPFNLGYLRPFRPWARCLTFVYGAIHGEDSSENMQVFLQELMKSLKRREADLALLEFVPLEMPLYRLALDVPGVLSRDTLPPAQGHDVMIVPPNIDEVYRRMSGTRREGIRRGMRKFAAHAEGKAKIVCYRSEAELSRLFLDAEQIAGKTYQRGLGAGFANTPEVRRRLELAVRKGWLRAYVLYVGDRPYSFWIGMLYHKAFVSEYLGYDPEFRKLSPGMFLIMRVIEGFCQRANGDTVAELDFGLGHAEYKGALCSKSWQEAPVYIFSPTLKGMSLKAMRAATRLADACARKALASTSSLSRLKRAWRDRLAQRAKAQTNSNRPTPVATVEIPSETSH